MKKSGRVLMVGLDGATWDLLSRLAADGTMPNLRRLQGDSRWGKLRSTVPPITPTAWAALSTGMNPGKSGLFSFYVPTDSIDKFRVTTSRDVRAETLPELLERSGFKVHVINLPTFSYPKKIKGTVLGDILCPPEFVVQPKTLLEKEAFRRYRSFPNMSLKRDTVRYFQDIRSVERARFDCTRELMSGDWDFIFVMFSGVDWIQHEAYRDLSNKNNTKATATALQFYRDLDSYLGWFISKLRPDDSLLIVSDHGFECHEGSFNINVWLQSKGFLRTKSSSRTGVDLTRGWGLRVPAIVLKAVSSHKSLWRLSIGVWRSFEGRSGFAGRLKADPQTSAAFSQDTSWGIRLNSRRRFRDGILDREEELRTLTAIKDELDKLAAAGVIEKHLPGEQVYSGRFASEGPDLVLFPKSLTFNALGYSVVDKLPTNGHSMDGIYMVHGPSAGQAAEGVASIYDIFPTVLALFGLAVPADVDGTALIEGTMRGSSVEPARGQATVLTQEEESEINARLRSLGYV